MVLRQRHGRGERGEIPCEMSKSQVSAERLRKGHGDSPSAVRLLQLCCPPPDGLLLGEDIESVGIDCPRGADEALRLHRLSILHPNVLPILLLDVEVQGSLDDGLTGDHTALRLALLRLLKPLLPRQLGSVLLECGDSIGDDGVDLTVVTLLLLQSTGGDPDLVRSGYRLASLVEDLTSAVGGFETSEGEPEFLRVRDDLDGASEKDASIFRVVLELDRLLPKLDGGGDVFESCERDGEVSFGAARVRTRSSPFRRTRFLALISVSNSTALIQMRTD